MATDYGETLSTASEPATGSPFTTGRLYLFLVLALTVFLAGVVLLPRPVSRRLVTTELGCLLPGASPDQLATLRAGLISDAAIRRALAAVTRQVATGPTAVSVTADQAAAVRHRLTVDVALAETGSVRVLMSYRGDEAVVSVALVDELAREFLKQQALLPASPRDDAKFRRLKWQADEARHYERKAQFDLETFIQTEFVERGRRLPAAAMAYSAATRHPGSLATDDVQRAKLERQLAELSDELDGLLVTHTPDHPAVQQLTRQLQTVRQQWDTASQGAGLEAPLAADRDRSPNAESSAVRAASALQPVERAVTGEGSPVVATFHARQNQLARARIHRDQAERLLWAYLERPSAARSAVEPGPRWVAVPPGVVTAHTARTSGTRVVMLGLLALLVGSVAVWYAEPLRGLPGESASQLGQFWPSKQGAGSSSLDTSGDWNAGQARRRRVVRWTVTACEVALTTMLVAFMWGALVDSPIAADFAQDPLRTFGETVGKFAVK